MYHIAMFMSAMVVRVVALGTVTPVSMPQAYSALLVERLLEQVMRLPAVILVVALVSSGQVELAASVGGSLLVLLALFAVIFWTVRHREQMIDSLVARMSHWGYSNEEQIRTTAGNIML